VASENLYFLTHSRLSLLSGMTVKGNISVVTDVTNIRKNVSKGTPSKNAKNGVSLDTLAQLRTNDVPNDIGPLRKCTKQSDKKALLKRARRKYMGCNLALKLVDASKKNPDSELSPSYWRAFKCAGVMLVDFEGKVMGKYCKLRWCPVCNAIRSAKLINQYKPHFQDWVDPHMVTLTIPNVPGDQLKGAIKEMTTNFRKVKDSLNKTAKRNGRSKLIGVRKLECTYNVNRDNYHPHFHFLIEGKSNSVELVNRWLKTNPTANRKAQDVRQADDASLKEVFKYFTKLITNGPKGDRAIYADALDVIFNAVSGAMTFRSLGFTMKKSIDTDAEKVSTENIASVWPWYKNDWVNPETGEMLSGYVPGEGMIDLVENKIKLRPRNKAN